MDLPLRLALLAKTGDSRAIPALTKALSASNFMIASVAASGLAQTHDNNVVPSIIAACKTQPWAAARVLADNLKFFDDPEAQRAFAFYYPNVNPEKAITFLGNSPFGPRFGRKPRELHSTVP